MLAIYRTLKSVIIPLLMWHILQIAAHTDIPAAVVVSGSMEPNIFRGDLIIVRNYSEALAPAKVGTIAVFTVPDRTTPIVHRIIHSNSTCIVTKGDNNLISDGPCIPYKDVKGYVQMIIPYAGWVTILLTEVIGQKVALALFILFSLCVDYHGSKNTDKPESLDERLLSKLFT